MPVWSVEGITEQPQLTLVQWQVMCVPNGDRHFVGYATANREGRASSAIRRFDVALLRGITRSGRVYQLSGRPGWNSDAEYTWHRWAARDEVTDWTDVTAEVWSAHELAKRPGPEAR